MLLLLPTVALVLLWARQILALDLRDRCAGATLWNGVNLPIMCYNLDNGWPGQVVPKSDFELYHGYGFNIFRYAFSWMGLSPDLNEAKFHEPYYSTFVSNVTWMLKQDPDIYIILDCHDFGEYKHQRIGENGSPATTEKFAAMWAKVATEFKDQSRVIFGIMNEPKQDASTQVVTDYIQKAINAIRKAGATQQYIFVPSKDWQGMSTFENYANSTFSITDPSGGDHRLVYDIHNYLDPGKDGGHECEDFKSSRLAQYTSVTNLLRSKNKKAFMSEIGGRPTLMCNKAINDALGFLDQHSDVWVGWTAWGPEQVQPDPRGSDTNSFTAFFIDCGEGDILHWAFLRRGVVGAMRGKNATCKVANDCLGKPVTSAAGDLTGPPKAIVDSGPALPTANSCSTGLSKKKEKTTTNTTTTTKKGSPPGGSSSVRRARAHKKGH